jgi:hypothetical protein
MIFAYDFCQDFSGICRCYIGSLCVCARAHPIYEIVTHVQLICCRFFVGFQLFVFEALF